MNETGYSINKQTENEQCTKYIYVYGETVQQMTLRGNSRGNLQASQGRLSELKGD
jgi:hypothetical protein